MADRLLAKANRSAGKGLNTSAKAYNFAGTVASDEIDASEIHCFIPEYYGADQRTFPSGLKKTVEDTGCVF